MKINTILVKIALAIAGGYFLSNVAITVFFPAKTPTIRPNLTAYLKEYAASFSVDIPNLIPKIDLASLFPAIPTSQSSSIPASPPDTSSGNLIVRGESAIASGVRQSLATTKAKSLTTGIYTSDNSSSYLTVAKQKEIEWTGTSERINGKMVYVRIPTGQTAPPSEMVRAIY